MSYISTTAPQEATGPVAELYSRLQGDAAYLPNYARVFCHRPELMASIGSLMKALRAPMQPRLWDLVNLAAARASHSSYCSLAFANKLINKHFSEIEVLEIVNNSDRSPVQEAEREAMAFAAKLARDSSSVQERDIETLRQCGFDEMEIFDIAIAAAWRCFFARVPDALGVQPDRALGDINKDLLAALLVGRQLEPETNLQQRSVESSPALQA